MYARLMYIDDILDRTADVLFLLSIKLRKSSALENAHTFLGAYISLGFPSSPFAVTLSYTAT